MDRTELSSSPFITTTDPTPSKLGFDQVQFISITGPCSSEKIISNSFEFCSGFIGLWVGIYIWLLYVFQYPRDICNQSIFAWHLCINNCHLWNFVSFLSISLGKMGVGDMSLKKYMFYMYFYFFFADKEVCDCIY